jgi:hypothetical protein
MNRFPRLLLLLLILVLPVGIFLFLKFFGRNEFNIPVYYENGIPADTLGCTYPDITPYQVMHNLPVEGPLVILLDGEDSRLKTADRNNLIRRIQSNSPEGVNIVMYYQADDIPDPLNDVIFIPSDAAKWDQITCLFVTDSKRQLILLDNQNQIRGYYGTELDEVDRLLVELDILTTL